MIMNMSDELKQLSKEMVETIEEEDKEYAFKKNKGFVERDVSASYFLTRAFLKNKGEY